jgi:tRNA (5-methylaminomethyl-2-thiouridylate)-methyltransferase
MKKKIAVLLSGGVDSSLALRLLHEQGHELHGFYLKIWLEDELSFLGNCPWQEDLSYIEPLCASLNVPLEVVPFQKEYWETIVSYVINEIKSGHTPNPDMLCNPHIKFGAFHRYLKDSFDYIATGHYAQKEGHEGYDLLCSAVDSFKDQTYFLASISQEQLRRALFPIGHLPKQKVRELATFYQLPAMQRKDSQGICFLGKLSFNDFIKHHVGTKQGPIIEYETGTVLGEHNGFWFHTIGQRKGLRLSGGPWFVVAKNVKENIVYASRHYAQVTELKKACIVDTFNWIYQEPKKENLEVKIRHGEQKYSCTLQMQKNGTGLITLETADQGLAPGQFTVFYDGHICLGSARIIKTI